MSVQIRFLLLRNPKIRFHNAFKNYIICCRYSVPYIIRNFPCFLWEKVNGGNNNNYTGLTVHQLVRIISPVNHGGMFRKVIFMQLIPVSREKLRNLLLRTFFPHALRKSHSMVNICSLQHKRIRMIHGKLWK